MTKERDRLDTLEQMCSAPSESYSADQWCHAANELLLLAHGLERERDALREALLQLDTDAKDSAGVIASSWLRAQIAAALERIA